jgi:hypothetical protein
VLELRPGQKRETGGGQRRRSGIRAVGNNGWLCAQTVEEFFNLEWSAKQKTLHGMTTQALEVVSLEIIFNALGDQVDTQAMGHTDDGSHQCGALAGVFDF